MLIFNAILLTILIQFSNCMEDNKAKRQSCGKYCGTGVCVLTTHPDPNFREACKCPDGKHQFEACGSTATVSPLTCISGWCLNGATCIPYNYNDDWCNPDQVGQTCCQCVTGYTGRRCETEIDECQSQPCQNGATCRNLVNAYVCQCAPGFTGRNCETRLFTLCSNSPCGQYPCLETPNFGNGFVCQCGPFDFRDKPCDQMILAPCVTLQCVNGVCDTSGSSAFCRCMPGFAGNRCETQYFRCTRNGRFRDVINCLKGNYFECVYYGSSQYPNGVLCSRQCPSNQRYNEKYDICDYAQNVPC